MNIEENKKMNLVKNENKKKYIYIDVAKGIGMFFVIWGHIILHGPIYNFIYSFHMPLFFFLSGLLFTASKYKTIREFVKRRIKTLIIPYLIFSFITYFYWVLVERSISGNEEPIWKPLIEIFISQGSSGYMIHNIPMWFVLCLFLVEILYYFLYKVSRDNKIKLYVIVAILTTLGYLMTMKNSFFDFSTLFWSADIALVALPFYTIGNLISEKNGKEKIEELVEKNKKISFLTFAILIIILSITCNINGPISMGNAQLGNIIGFYINAFIGIIAILIASVITKKSKLLQFLGHNSFFIMATHFPIRKPIIIMIAMLFATSSNTIYNSPILSLLVAILTLIVEIVLIKVISIIKIKKDDKK